MEIYEITSDEQYRALYPLVRQMYPDMSFQLYENRLSEMRNIGYRCIGAFEKNVCLGMSGFWFGTQLHSGRFLEIDNLVVDEAGRSRGVGKALVAWMEAEARRVLCAEVRLSAYVERSGAHRFYFREGYIVRGFHFKKYLTEAASSEGKPVIE